MPTGREKIIIGVLAGLLLMGLGFKYSGSLPGSGEQTASIQRGETFVIADSTENGENEAADIVKEEVTVHVVGGVNNPGIYSLPEGSRVNDAIDKAGGPSAEGDLESINIARPLVDGEQVRVPLEGEEAADAATGGEAGASASAGGKININRAGVSELTTLTGIGDKRAESIIRHREENGPFNSIEEIMNVTGIGDGIFNNIKDDITVH